MRPRPPNQVVWIGLLLAIAGCSKDKPTAAPEAGTDAGSAAIAHDKLAGEMVKIPAHTKDKARVGAFEIDKTEVTVRAYRACVEAGACQARWTVDWDGLTEEKRRKYSQPCNWGTPDRDTHPMNCVDWQDAERFCTWAGKRLPTEQEWEYAAGGKAGNDYPWGANLPIAPWSTRATPRA